jgi:N-acetylglutamate synthase-like GNAT family acetyltransferase
MERGAECRAPPPVAPLVGELRDGRRCEIFFLAQQPHLVESCSRLCFAEFEAAYRDLGFDSAAAVAANLCKSYLVPLVLVALARDGEFLGTVTLDEEDMRTRPELTPWVADLLVVPAARGQGVASVLLRALLAVSKTIGVDKLYLWTEKQAAFFATRGFERVDRLECAGATAMLMCSSLTQADETLDETAFLKFSA